MDGDARKNCRRTVAEVGPSSAKEPQRHGASEVSWRIMVRHSCLANGGASSRIENR